MPSSGRMRELLIPSARVYVLPAANPLRKTRYDLALVEYRGFLVSVNSHLPNDLTAEALSAGRIPELAGYTKVWREKVQGPSRLDFVLAWDDGTRCLLEVKSVTLVEDGVAKFPDAPTARGTRHLMELTAAAGQGERAVVLFMVQREDGQVFSPNDSADPEFGQALRWAAKNGVEILCYRCQVTLSGVQIDKKIPIRL